MDHDMASSPFTNNGTVAWSDGRIRGGGTMVYNNGVWDAQNDQVFNNDFFGSGTVYFNNSGTFRKSGSAGGSTTFISGVTFNQLAGKLDSQINAIVLNGGGS